MNCRVKRHLISTRTLKHGSSAETKPASTICTQGIKMDDILLDPKLDSKVITIRSLIITNQLTKLQKASLGFPSASNNKGHVVCTVGNERSQLLLSVTFQVITAVTVPGYLAYTANNSL